MGLIESVSSCASDTASDTAGVPEDMFRADAAPGGRLEVELEERVVLLGP